MIAAEHERQRAGLGDLAYQLPDGTHAALAMHNAWLLDENAQKAWDDGQKAIRNGDFAAYGEAQKRLAGRGFSARVFSGPSFELFAAADAATRRSVIGNAKVNVAVEAAVRQGWDAIIGSDGVFVGMSGFGASAPYRDLYRHFGITAEKVAEAALSRLGS